MQMLRKTVGIDFEQVGISIRPDVEYAVFLGNHSRPAFRFSSILYGEFLPVNEIFW